MQDITWTVEDAEVAMSEGWLVVLHSEGDRLEIQKYDMETSFKSDDEALAYVTERSAEGGIHKQALDYITQENEDF